MPIFQRLVHVVQRLTEDLSWFGLFGILLLQVSTSWVLLWLCGETELIHPDTFIYYSMVVVSTVGFGDFSPVTSAGKYVVALYQIPTGLLVFGALIGKFSQLALAILRKGMNGLGDYSDYQDHVLVFGWNADKTEQVIQYILADKKRLQRKIILCVTRDMQHPFADKFGIEFAKMRSFTEPTELARVAANKAARIIIDGEHDDETLTTALALGAVADKNANISAYFIDQSKSKLLKLHCDNVECSSSHQAEMLVRSMQDPGSSQVAEQLFSVTKGATLYSMVVPESYTGGNFESLAQGFRQQYRCTVVGIASYKNGNGMQLNPASDFQVSAGQYIHYIADVRLLATEVDWPSLAVK
ncbi:potassium channel family protein [Motilimonas pumila]|uniref:Two pore domain potassium channel family protein n=1 Tax=Motilimonas pumila TaxID=2303987 RepID=A0A418YHG7_9GAMM|nr:potassium channel family protein [Motilimonas pumila]RJG49515.1 two pore domain potassium channel family protein [Motilimonas pumila]